MEINNYIKSMQSQEITIEKPKNHQMMMPLHSEY
jgi:hypothetical protein